ncbi:glucosaminidase domain-containing protein [Paenibacillus taichungensis]|uniref:glucosaminidase domain-containing protein n=2 Tax=Paenibacillus TaxID=44249 RepID=UPI00068FBB62|nr:glucosaminidase domain-containing protein [Paenibacillus taichungensis]OZQ71069.1 hypothetical protein CA599_11080 [Paenibacillus taichungensis]
MLKEHLKRKVKQKVQKKVKDLVTKGILKSPVFWIVSLCLIGVFGMFYLIAAAVSSAEEVAGETQIFEGILPPTIYVRNFEQSITSDYGTRKHPVTGEAQSFHKGIDIGIPEGTPVTNSFEGVVTKVSYPRSTDPASTQNAGIYVTVQSTNPQIGMSSRYLHLSEALVTPGQYVSVGDVIGLSGNTGRSTGPHLHFEMIPEGQEAIDPKPFVMLMSKLTETASIEAFDVAKKIKWTGVDAEAGASFESNKILYINNVFMESAAPTFTDQGTIYIRELVNGGINTIQAILPDGSEVSEPTPEAPPVQIPSEIGNLTNPFFIAYASAAQEEERRSGVPASISLAQAALESGYGKRSICNNMFGIKANKSWKGPTCTATTHEEIGGISVQIQAKFRSYSSPLASFADHSAFLLKNSRYKKALKMENPFAFANELQRAGYATDSQYANKLKSIMRSQNLVALDMNRGIDPATGLPFENIGFGGFGGDNGGVYNGLIDSITITFGLRQYYGTPSTMGNSSSPFRDPDTGKTIVNLENYNRVVNLGYGGDLNPPRIFMKDIPNAVTVTIDSTGKDALLVSNIDYIKGKY